MNTKRENRVPICPHCGKSMRLALAIPSSGALPELHLSYWQIGRETAVGEQA
jgi:hypothetical protein